MRELDLAIVIREHKSFRALENAEPAALKTGGVLAGANSFTARLHPNHSNGVVLKERMKKSDRIASTADTSNENVRQAAFAFKNLAARFESDHTLKIAD